MLLVLLSSSLVGTYSILNIAFPTIITQLRSFIGTVNFYRAFWRKRADLLAPLTALSGRPKGPLKKTPELLKAFNAVKKCIAEEVLLCFPDPNLPFEIFTDASQLQLGAVITQVKPSKKRVTIAFFSRKLSPAQVKYATNIKEMLCIVEVLKEYRSILCGAKIIVRTDHINLTRQNISSNKIMTWRLLCDDFNPIFRYIKGPQNVIADALSRLPLIEKEKGNPSSVPSKVPSTGPSTNPSPSHDLI